MTASGSYEQALAARRLDQHNHVGVWVKEQHAGYTIRLLPGDHPKVTTTHVFLVPHGDDLSSGDGDLACLHPTEVYLDCLRANFGILK